MTRQEKPNYTFAMNAGRTFTTFKRSPVREERKTCRQFHQHFTRAFFIQKSFESFFICLEFGFEQTFV